MKKLALCTLITLVCGSVLAEDWIHSAGNDEADFFIKPGSLSFSKNKSKENIAVVTGKLVMKPSTQTTFFKWYVRLAECESKQGKIVSLNLSGEYQYENEFIVGSGTIASINAQSICSAADYITSEKRKKSM